jgi:hypothetical protein
VFEEVSNADHSQYGVTSGWLLDDDSGILDCGCISYGWPAWAFSASSRGWRVKCILVKDTVWVDFLNTWFKGAEVTALSPNFRLSDMHAKIRFWFSDMDIPRAIRLWDSDFILLVTTRRVRHVSDPAWKMTPKVVSHVEVGGCTDGQWSIYYYTKGSIAFDLGAGSTALRDLTSVLDPKVNGIPCPAPGANLDAARHPQVIQLRPNVYHGGGLIPWSARSSYIVAPSIYSPTRWVRRRLTNLEMGSLLDYSAETIKGLSQNQLSSVVKDTGTIPQKVLVKALDIVDFSIWARESPALTHLFTHADTLVAVSEAPEKSAVDPLTRNDKAVKNDDAPVPEYLWDDVIVPDRNVKCIAALSVIRLFALRWWRKHITKEFLTWLNAKHNGATKSTEYKDDVLAGRDCIERCSNATWWEWDAGSRPLF